MMVATRHKQGYGGLWWLVPLIMLSNRPAAANDLTFEFKYRVVAASCTLSVPNSTVLLGSGGHLDPTALVGQNWKFLGETTVPVTLSNCAGTPDAGALPYVDVATAGTTVALTTAGLYRDSTSASQGFGVVMGNDVSASSLTSGGLVTAANPRVKLSSAAAIDGTYNLRVGVACGGTNDCAAANLSGGTLKAAFTLDFNYH